MNLFKRTCFFTCLGIFSLSVAKSGAFAQEPSQAVQAEWDLPENLSQSGTAAEPSIVIDGAGQRHVLWLDAFDGIVHTESIEEGWTVPQALAGPFTGNVPLLITDSSERIHAFWRDETSILFYSRLVNGAFTDADAWTPPVQLGISVLVVDAIIGEENTLHVSYMKNISDKEGEEEPVEEDPAGVYYLSSDNGGVTWSDPSPVYDSLYYRQLEEKDARVRIAVNRNSIFIAWDDRPGERILSTRSFNGGQEWTEIRQVDGRDALDDSDATSPSQVDIVAWDNLVLLQWQAEHGEGACTLYYQWSGNGGITWQHSQQIVQDMPACEGNSELFFFNDLLFLILSHNESYDLMAWQNGRWSEPAEQVSLSDFRDPETLRPLTLSCLQGVTANDQVYLVGCGGIDGGDIWVTASSVGDTAVFFPPPSIWRTPETITSSEASIVTPVSIADGEGRVHLFWSQAVRARVLDLADNLEDSIYYAQWDGRIWLGSVGVVSSPSGSAENPAVALDHSGNLLLVWSGSAGEVYFSKADASRANATSAWAEPQRLPVPRSAAGRPDILVDQAGNIFVAYAVSLNEQRGVYVTKSGDSGGTWSDPQTVFDGATADWDMVETPRLAQTDNGSLYVMWVQYSMPPEQRPLGLYYAYLATGEDLWSSPKLVTEGAILWADILGIDERVVHRVWHQISDENAALWHEFSLDGGLTWSDPALIILGIEDPFSPANITPDLSGRLQLFQVTNNILHHWLWDKDRWLSQDQLALTGNTLSALNSLTAAASEDELTVVYSGSTLVSDESELKDELYFTIRPMDKSAEAPTALPTLTQSPVPVATNSPEPGPSPTPTVFLSTEMREESGQSSSTLTREPLLFGLLPVGMLVLIALVAGVQIRSARNRRG